MPTLIKAPIVENQDNSHIPRKTIIFIGLKQFAQSDDLAHSVAQAQMAVLLSLAPRAPFQCANRLLLFRVDR